MILQKQLRAHLATCEVSLYSVTFSMAPSAPLFVFVVVAAVLLLLVMLTSLTANSNILNSLQKASDLHQLAQNTHEGFQSCSIPFLLALGLVDGLAMNVGLLALLWEFVCWQCG